MGIQVLQHAISLTTNGNKCFKLTHELLFEMKDDVHDVLDIVCNINSALSKCCLLYKC